MQENKKYYCGYVALLGRSNVGKSTLFNSMLGMHLAAVTHKRQTTRYNIDGILTKDNYQMIFVDTPGLHLGRKGKFNKALNDNAQLALSHVDLAVFMVVQDIWTKEDDHVLRCIVASQKPCLLIINQCDLIKDKRRLLKVIETISQRHDFDEIFPISALYDKTFDPLKLSMAKLLPQFPELYFPKEQLTSLDDRFFIAEFIREQAILQLHRELPYAIHVGVESMSEEGDCLHVSAVIRVLKDSQRGIVIGESGERLKRIGTKARASIEEFLGKQIYLKLWVKVAKDWQDKAEILETH